MDGGAVVKRLTLLLLACCGGADPNDPKYPTSQCADLHAAPRDPSALVDDDWRASIFADERDAWLSPKCDETRHALRALGDGHDLEETTLKKECDEAARGDLACRAGCFAERRHDALVAGWARALRDVRAFAPLDWMRFEKECHGDLFRCRGLPPLPKRFEVRAERRWASIHYGNTSSTKTIGLDSLSVSLTGDGRARAVFFTECRPSRWDVFYREGP
jgi:hypothetical protein